MPHALMPDGGVMGGQVRRLRRFPDHSDITPRHLKQEAIRSEFAPPALQQEQMLVLTCRHAADPLYELAIGLGPLGVVACRAARDYVLRGVSEGVIYAIEPVVDEPAVEMALYFPGRKIAAVEAL